MSALKVDAPLSGVRVAYNKQLCKGCGKQMSIWTFNPCNECRAVVCKSCGNSFSPRPNLRTAKKVDTKTCAKCRPHSKGKLAKSFDNDFNACG